MRTTLELDDDLLVGAKKLAKQQGLSLGRVISDLALKSLLESGQVKVRNGFRLLPSKPVAARHDMELVNRLRDEE